MGTTATGQAISGVGVSAEPLRERVRGRVLTADDGGYDEARAVHNGMFDKRPLAVLRAEQVADAAPQGQARDAGGRDDATGGRQAESVGGVVEVTPGGAGVGAGRLVPRIHADGAHR